MSSMSNNGSWQAVFFVAVVAALLGAISIAAILHYETVDDALKIWAGLSGLVGILIGAGGAYVPAQAAVKSAE